MLSSFRPCHNFESLRWFSQIHGRRECLSASTLSSDNRVVLNAVMSILAFLCASFTPAGLDNILHGVFLGILVGSLLSIHHTIAITFIFVRYLFAHPVFRRLCDRAALYLSSCRAAFHCSFALAHVQHESERRRGQREPSERTRTRRQAMAVPQEVVAVCFNSHNTTATHANYTGSLDTITPCTNPSYSATQCRQRHSPGTTLHQRLHRCSG